MSPAKDSSVGNFPTHNIKRIEVVASPMSALYGANALAGVINIITKDGDKEFDDVELTLETGSFDTYGEGFLFGIPVGELSVKGSVYHYSSDEEDFLHFVQDTDSYSRGWVNNNDASPFINDYDNPSDATSLNLQLDYEGFYIGGNYYRNRQSHGLEKLRWDYSDGVDERDFLLVYCGFDDDINDSMRLKTEYQFCRSYLWGRYDAGLWPVSRLQSPDGTDIFTFPNEVTTSSGEILRGLDEIKDFYPSYYDALVDLGYLDPANMTEDDINQYFRHIYTNKDSRGSQRHRFDLLHSWEINDRLSLDSGYTYDNVDYVGMAVTDAGFGNGDSLSIPVDLSKRDSFYQSDKHGIYTQFNLALIKEQLWFSGGARYDNHSYYGDTVNPRVGMVWRPNSDNIFKVLYGEAFREPNVFELASDPDADPAKLRSYEASYQHIFSESLQFHITGYHSVIDDFLGSVGSLIGTGVGSVQEQTVQGLEGELDAKFGSILAFANASYLIDAEQELKDDITHTTETVDVLGIPDAKTNFGVGYLFNDHYSISLVSSYIWSYDALSGNTAINEPFDIPGAFDLKLTLQAQDIPIGKNSLNGFLTINNLTDQKNYHANIRRSGPHKFL